MTTETHRLYFDDLAHGRTFSSRPYRMSTEEIKAFAAQYDPQPFHTDEIAAGQTFFAGLAASGWHTAAVTMRLLVECFPVAGGLVGAGVEDLRWLRPVRPGDALTLTIEILSRRESASKPDQGWIRVKHTMRNQHGEAVQVFVSSILVPKQAD